jgi:hypothetical protein
MLRSLKENTVGLLREAPAWYWDTNLLDVSSILGIAVRFRKAISSWVLSGVRIQFHARIAQ